jgi:ABC-type glycerol-3-phosphate transport system substrate-binding protein
VTISYAVWEHERTIYEPLVAKFTAANPAIKIVLVPLEDIVSVPDQNGQDSALSALRRLVSAADAGPALFMPTISTPARWSSTPSAAARASCRAM